MSFDRDKLVEACRAYGRVARVVVAETRGSAPREVGVAMLVWEGGQSGTIGGGTLEHETILAARQLLGTGKDRLTSHSLGPDLGQCCGGAVKILTVIYDLKRAQAVPDDLAIWGEGHTPLTVSRIQTQFRNSGVRPQPGLVDGWMIEPIVQPMRHLWIWGAGHVGRALVDVLAPLPEFDMTWVDTAAERFPEHPPEHVHLLVAPDPAAMISYAPAQAEHLIVTYSHALDLALCHGLLRHGFGFAGLIGSRTKWARFRRRLTDLGCTDTHTARITCPIGDPSLGKHPQAIAIGVAASLLERSVSVAHQQKDLA